MKHLIFIIVAVLLFLIIPIFSQSSGNLSYRYSPTKEELVEMENKGVVFNDPDSTRLKSYENYVLQIDTQIKDTENKILELQKYLLQLQGAKSAFEAVISDEKKYIEQKK